MRLPWRRNGHGTVGTREAAKAREAAEAELDRARQETPHVEAFAEDVESLPKHQYNERVRRALWWSVQGVVQRDEDRVYGPEV